MHRAALSLIAALILGVLTVYTVGASSSADAFVPGGPPPKHFDPVSAQEKRIFDEIVKRSYSSDSATSSKAREILTRQLTRSAPRLGSQMLARTGLVGAAAGVWTVVGLELYYLPCWECGQQSLKIGQQIKLADGAVWGNTRYNDEVMVQGVVTSYAVDVVDGVGSARITMQQNIVSYRVYNYPSYTRYEVTNPEFGVTYTSVGGGNPVQSDGDPPAPLRIPGTQTSTWDGRLSYTGPVDITATRVLEGTNQTTTYRSEICSNAQNCRVSKTLPTIALGGGSSDSFAESTNKVPTTAEEGNRFINNVVADPETKPLVDPMDVPETEPDPNWDPDKDPFNPLFDPFLEPEGDPDGDGVPNRLDPDPEGDGDPDGDGDPNEHPIIAPNPDPAEDPEGDGDPDGDGDPNETNPSPAPAPLPNDDPDSDPDQDGIPNREDPDQDGDNIPNEDDPDPVAPTAPGDLPRFHPYADPDEDGSPNRDDRDDDGDDREDWEDDKPFTPSEPGPDTDTDGVPDWSDPWPGNPYAPADPTKDGDGDGTPDYKDPEIGIPYIPWRTTTDEPDAPDRQVNPPNDPDVPYDPALPPPWSPNTPGTPNVPTTPGNPASPPYAPGTPNPPDLSTGITNPPPTRPDVPDDPTTTDSPDVPPGEPGDPGDPPPDNPEDPPPTDPPTDGGSCPVVEPPSFDVPKLNIDGLFPFSLVLWVVGNVQVLAAANSSVPCLDIPVVGEWCFDSPGIKTVINTMYGLLWFFGGTFQVLGFYVLIKGGRGTE